MLWTALFVKHCKFVPDGLALLQDSPNTFRLSSECRITVIVGEAHALDVLACVFFSRCWIWVTEWDPGVMKLLLLPPRIYVYAVDIKCIISITFMCRRLIEDKNADAIRVCVLKDCKGVLSLFEQLREVPPCIEHFPWVYDLLSFNRGKMELLRELKLFFNLLIRELQSSYCLADEVQDMDCVSGTFLLDRLLILREPCASAILVSMEYSLVLHDQDMFLLPR